MFSAGVGIEIKDLYKIYKSGSVEVVALRGLDLTVEPGEVVSIMGPSGCGKTTLLNIIGGLDKASAGSVLVDRRDLTHMNNRALEGYRLREVGCIFQFFNLLPDMTALENVELPMLLAKTDARTMRVKAAELLSRVGLASRSLQKPEELSGGEQQRVAIACALANDPPLLMADEPTGELDRDTAKAVIDVLVQLIRRFKKTAIMVTHDPMVAGQADRILRMEDGRITGRYNTTEAYQLTSRSKAEAKDEIQARVQLLEREIHQLEADFRTAKLDSEGFVEKYNSLRRTIRTLLNEE